MSCTVCFDLRVSSATLFIKISHRLRFLVFQFTPKMSEILLIYFMFLEYIFLNWCGRILTNKETNPVLLGCGKMPRNYLIASYLQDHAYNNALTFMMW